MTAALLLLAPAVLVEPLAGGAWRISNGAAEAVVNPALGRITRFGWPGGPNLLWESELEMGGWKNHGGDKVWPAPQADWNWPPETEYDPGVWALERIPRGVLMRTLRPGSKTGALFERRIQMHPGLPILECQTVLTNGAASPRRMSPWQVTQIDRPSAVWLPLAPSDQRPRGYSVYGDADDKGLTEPVGRRLRIRAGDEGMKYGSASPEGWVAAEAHGVEVRLWARFYEWADYPDGGLAQQVYTSPESIGYVELELAGPLKTLAPGQSTRLDTRLSFSQTPIVADRSDSDSGRATSPLLPAE